jgi:SAM-dependent methyltransferase
MKSDDAGQRWDERWTSHGDVPQEPAALVASAQPYLPASGTAIDVAGGTGRHALWLARLGLDATLVDVSQVALDTAAQAARNRDLAITTIRRDLEAEGMPPGTWDVVLMHYFLDRNLFAQVPDALETGGVFVFCQPTVRNLERHERPGRRYLLEEGELAALIDGLPLVPLVLEESWSSKDRHEARLIARLQHQRRAN